MHFCEFYSIPFCIWGLPPRSSIPQQKYVPRFNMLLKESDASHASSDNRGLNIRDCGDLLYCINHQICKYRFFSSLCLLALSCTFLFVQEICNTKRILLTILDNTWKVPHPQGWVPVLWRVNGAPLSLELTWRERWRFQFMLSLLFHHDTEQARSTFHIQRNVHYINLYTIGRIIFWLAGE